MEDVTIHLPLIIIGEPSGRKSYRGEKIQSVRFEVFTAVTMKNGVFWDVTPCGSCKN
jgi:hypothetical protein